MIRPPPGPRSAFVRGTGLQHATCDCECERQSAAGLDSGEHLLRVRRLLVWRIAHGKHEASRLVWRQHAQRDFHRAGYEPTDASRDHAGDKGARV